MLLSLLLLSLNFSSFFHFSFARGADRPGSVGSIHGRSGRQLFGDEERMSEEERIQKLEKLAQGYMSNSDLEEAIKKFNQRCSNISRIYRIGKSVLHVPLWTLEISNMPGKKEAKPAFKFIGNVHGDEPVGRELLLRLANWLCDNYKSDLLATLIVDKVHLHILPSMNPDGFALRQRNNANNVDLNRDFPDQFFPMNDDMDLRQPETKAIMKWLDDIEFTASATLHGKVFQKSNHIYRTHGPNNWERINRFLFGSDSSFLNAAYNSPLYCIVQGALVANYPWDGTEDKKRWYYGCPDDETFKFLASLYSTSHYNMSRSTEFPGGITNGALWYPIYGGMQDFNYIHHGCFELTLEISDDKWPNAHELSTLWEYNRMSMLNLIAGLVETGIHGRVISSDNGKPLPASIIIRGINSTITARKELADYHRLTVPGQTYEVIALMPGYRVKSACVHGNRATTVDFVLDRAENESDSQVLEESGCYHNWGRSKHEVMEYLAGAQVDMYLLVIIVIIGILGFLWLVLKRMKKSFQIISQRHPKRAAV